MTGVSASPTAIQALDIPTATLTNSATVSSESETSTLVTESLEDSVPATQTEAADELNPTSLVRHSHSRSPTATSDTNVLASPLSPDPSAERTPRPPSLHPPTSVRRSSALQHKPSASSSDLEALLSPTRPSAHNSLATPPTEDFGEISLDDDSDPRFSTVALTARDSTSAIKSPVGEAPPLPWTGSPSDDDLEQFSYNHDSTDRASWLLQRLEHQKQGEHSQRSSVEGTQKLQEQFRQRHSETESSVVDWEFWGTVISDYQTFASENPEKLAQAIERGIPDTLRGMMWQLMAASKDPELEATYIHLIKEVSTHEKAIMRDLGRTFPHHDFFTDGHGIGQENLFNVLKAYSLHDPQVGYCQGLPFVVAVLLLNMPDEEAFSLLVRLMHSYDLRGHFLPEMPKLQLHLFQFDRLIEELLPVLHLHFVRQGIKSSMFCSQWFLTLFSYRFPLEIVYRIFDNCLASGIEAIFGFALALLKMNEEKLLSLKFDELVAFLNSQIVDTYKVEGKLTDEGKPLWRTNNFVRDAMALRITPFMLDAYAHEYAEMVRQRDAHLLEVDSLRRSNRNLSSQVNALELSLAQMNQEHVDVLNELVKARLQSEELERELVRYKLLYAESVHKTEDALSSHRLSTNTSVSNGGSKRPSLQSMISGFTKSSSS